MYQLSLSLSETTPPIIKIVGAFGFLFLTKLGISDNVEINSFCVLTDSGTVQEECAIFKIPNIILRDKTERPETIESGSSIISMKNKADILNTKNINLISLFFDLLVTTKNSDILSKKMNYFLKNENFNLKTKHKIESKYKLN